MNSSERAALIRKGNEYFNLGDYKGSLKIFLATGYNDGIIRVADYLYFDKQDKISAVKLYKKAGHKKVLDDFTEKAAGIIRMMLSENRTIPEEKPQQEEPAVKEWNPVVLSEEEIAGLRIGSKEKKPDGKENNQK